MQCFVILLIAQQRKLPCNVAVPFYGIGIVSALSTVQLSEAQLWKR